MTAPHPGGGAPSARLQRLVFRARAALAWETAWRAIASVLVAGAFFVATAWSGLLLDRSPALRIALLLGCAALGLYGVARAVLRARVKGQRLDRRAALARIDRDSGFTYGQASGFEDTLANPADPAATVLWRLHQSRMAAALGTARVRSPRPGLARFDSHALRAGAVLLLVAAAFVAGEERSTRLAAALDWGQAAPPAVSTLRIDAWIDPPGYTGKPPIILTGDATDRPLSAPVGSTVVVRASDPASVTVATEGAIAPKPVAEGAIADDGKRFVLRGDATVTVSGGGARSVFAITAIPDKPPTVELTSPPKPNLRGTFTVGYRLADDYGVIGAEARFSAPEIDGKPLTGRTLVPPPRVGLTLPAGQGGTGEASTTVDLSDHPWAGIRATLVLHAQDEGGNEGVSQPVAVQLPQRRFTKPLARALVEQRRNLVLDPDRRERVASALDALTIAPELFGTTPGEFLGLHIGGRRLAAARTDDALREVADYLWNMALQIEDGDLSGAERDLRTAQKELRDAIARGAPDEEIRKLTENLRAAMDKFLNEMLEKQAREDGERGADQPRGNRNARAITRDDLKAMMDRMEEMARSGNLAEAQRMLDQMQQLMENLRTAKRGKRNPQAQEMREMFDELDALTREQDKLRDDTFRGGRQKSAKPNRRKGGEPEGSPSDDGEEDTAENGDGRDAGTFQALKDRQKGLRDKLGELERRLERLRRGRGEKKLGDAEGAMKDAEDALGEADGDAGKPGEGGQPGKGPKGKAGRGGRDAAVEAQGRALEALRQGAQSMAQRMPGQGQDSGDGPGDGDMTADGDGDGEPEPGQPREGNGGTRDPLGRPTSRDPLYNPRAKYDPMGASPALRAQRVLEELRRRLGDPSRPQGELDYLERLLRRY